MGIKGVIKAVWNSAWHIISTIKIQAIIIESPVLLDVLFDALNAFRAKLQPGSDHLPISIHK